MEDWVTPVITVFIALNSIQLPILFSHEKRLTRIEAKLDLLITTIIKNNRLSVTNQDSVNAQRTRNQA